jgi:two-component sensor histidine kinase
MRLTYVNRVAEAWWGRRREDLLGKKLWEEFPGAVGSAVYEAHVIVMRERRVERVEALSPIIGGWLDVSVFPRGDGGLSVYFRDISDRKKTEEQQQLMVSELTHRVKNILATVQAIATQSLRPDEVAPAARERFMQRLLALAYATDVLVAEKWEGASLEAIARQAASPHASPEDEGRFSIVGPPVRLSAGAATAFALALHELATNAAKYGSLSTATGSVALTWAVENADAAPRLEVQWCERGGPTVEPPKRSGFGLRLLERGLATELDAEVRIEYHPSGLTCDISAPLPA